MKEKIPTHKNEGLYKKPRAKKASYDGDNKIKNPRARNQVDARTLEPTNISSQIELVKKELPHIYGWKWYKWARVFFNSENRVNLLCAANQISKSSTAIRKNIEWACNKKLWPKLFKRREPKLFYYFYPSADVATIEFQSKWVPEFLPRGGMRDHQEYGWRVEYSGGQVDSIHFNSGVILYFKAYSQKIINLQTATVDMITFDEEAPENYVDESLARLVATDGYFNMVFTATIGQPLWFKAMECIGTPEETFKHAHKQVVSMYDCQVYDDGSEGAWPLERIKKREQMCTTEAERLKRVMGRFVKDEGKRYPAFISTENCVPSGEIPKDWKFYAGVDIGSGGAQRSAGAIIIIAVNPTNTSARVVRSWRGDNEDTTAADILNRYIKLKEGIVVEQAAYDHGSREFALISGRLGYSFLPADKGHVSGIDTVNALLKQKALLIHSEDYDNPKLVVELETVPMEKTTNRKFKDDLSDAMRYAVKLVPWDFEQIGFTPREYLNDGSHLQDTWTPRASWTPAQYQSWEIRMRRGEIPPDPGREDGQDDTALMIDAWNEEYGT